jgi:hypothetical protein
LESIAKTLEHTEKYVENVSVTPVVQPVKEVIVTPASPNVVIEELPLPMSFTAPEMTIPVIPANNCPITDNKSLIAYVMESYKKLGPVNGAKIQEVLTACGYANINEVKPESYGALFAGVEALK